MSYYREQLESWLNEIKVKTDRVYDVGGLERPVRKRVSDWRVHQYEILDLPKFDLNEFESGTAYAEKNGLANVVFCLEVMEYIYDPFMAAKNLNGLLKDGGLLYISFPFLYPVHEPAEIDYMRYTRFGAERLLQLNDFIVLENRPRLFNYKQAWGELVALEGYRAKGAYRTETFYDTGCLIKAKKA